VTTTDRGYGWAHQQLRESWRPAVEAGEVQCWRCGETIPPGQPWDLGHDDDDRSVYQGPEHQGCNRTAAANTANTANGRRAQTSACWCGGACLVHVDTNEI
jgi:hypothetical protein